MKGAEAIKLLNWRSALRWMDGGNVVRPAVRYGFAFFFLAAALAVRFALNPILQDRMPYALFAAAAMLATWAGRIRTGSVTLVVGMFLGYYFFVFPQHTLGPFKAAETTVFLSALIPAAISVWIIELLHRSRERATQATADVRSHARQLEHEIQERQQVEKEIRCSHRITRAISEASDLCEALTSVLRELCECTGWGLGQAWMFSPDGTTLACAPSVYIANRQFQDFRKLSERTVFKPGVGMIGKAWKTRQIQWLPDLRQEHDFIRRDLALELGIESAAAFPVLAGDKVLAVIEFFLLDRHDESDRLVRLVSSVAVQLGVLIQRKQAEEALRESERRYQTLARVSPVGIFRADADGRCNYVNDRWAEISGFETSKAMGDGWLRAVHPQDRARVAEKWKNATAMGVAVADEFRFLRADGSIVWVFGQSARDIDERGETIGYVGTITDITERKLTEEKLQQSERRLSEAQRIARIGSWEWDVASNRVAWSKELYDIIGINPDDFSGKYEAFLERVHPDDQDEVRASIARSLSDGSAYDFEHRFIRGDGQVRFFHCRGRAQLDADGEVISMAGAAQDITERKHFELELEKAQVQLQEYATTLEKRVGERTSELQSSMKQMEGFCYSIAHDLRAPLRAMEGFAHAILDDYGQRLDEVGSEYAKRIVAASQRMDHLIQDLLAYGRLSHVELPGQWLNLEDEIDFIIAEHMDDIRARGAEININRPLHSIWANTTVLTQILGNLISNALKFVAPGVPPVIDVWSEKRGHATRVWVKDNGIGIAPEHHARIFRVFEKLHDPADYHGTGIGLAIASKAVERLNGQMGVESTLGKGSCFWFELPNPPARSPEKITPAPK